MENNRNPEHHLLHSYCLHPSVRFEAQGANEIPILVLRSHPFTQISWMINTFIIGVLLIVLTIFASQLLSLPQIIFIDIAGIFFIFTYIWYNFLNWFFNVGIITNQRIIDIDYSAVIYKEISETHLDRVEDITSKSGGYFESFFD
jgi:hypothetical protein